MGKEKRNKEMNYGILNQEDRDDAMTPIDFMEHKWSFLEYLRPLARPGWWTLKRWVELMWSRQTTAFRPE